MIQLTNLDLIQLTILWRFFNAALTRIYTLKNSTFYELFT